MTFIDRWLQDWRVSKAIPFIQGELLDIVCHDGSIFERFQHASYVGVDRKLEAEPAPHLIESELVEFRPGRTFDTIACLASFEHFDASERKQFWRVVRDSLRVGGRLVMTVPHPLVDHVLCVGKRAGLLDGMEDHQHRDVKSIDVIQEAISHGLELLVHQPFQLGLNHLLVFQQESAT